MKAFLFSKTKKSLFSAFFLLFVSSNLLLFCAAESSADCTWTGTWNVSQRYSGSEFTVMVTLEQNGSQVTGFSDLVGTVSGETVSFPNCFVKTNGV